MGYIGFVFGRCYLCGESWVEGDARGGGGIMERKSMNSQVWRCFSMDDVKRL